jgi:hypothetical protein
LEELKCLEAWAKGTHGPKTGQRTVEEEEEEEEEEENLYTS